MKCLSSLESVIKDKTEIENMKSTCMILKTDHILLNK